MTNRLAVHSRIRFARPSHLRCIQTMLIEDPRGGSVHVTDVSISLISDVQIPLNRR